MTAGMLQQRNSLVVRSFATESNCFYMLLALSQIRQRLQAAPRMSRPRPKTANLPSRLRRRLPHRIHRIRLPGVAPSRGALLVALPGRP